MIFGDEVDDLTEEEIDEFAEGYISRHKVLRWVHAINVYPMTVSGKVCKEKLREMVPKIRGWV